MEYTEFCADQRQLFRSNPYAFWAKKFDQVIHLVDNSKHATVCGSHSALLGNNYAPDKSDLPLCDRCLSKSHSQLQLQE